MTQDDELVEVIARCDFEIDRIGGTLPWEEQEKSLHRRYFAKARRRLAALRAGGWEVVSRDASAAKDAEIARLQQLAYSPGCWRCPKCKFTLVQSNLNTADGTVTARDTPGDKCPNCDSPLWRVSWKQDAMENLDTACRLTDEVKSKNAEIARLREALELAERAEKQHLNCKECGGEDLPECCAACWPSADAARLARWNVLSKGQKRGNVIRLKEPSHG